MVGLSGQIRKTTNGGTTWVPQTSGTTRHLTHVSFSNANEGVAAGYSVLLRTTNGGNVWTVVDTTEGPAAFHVAAGQVYGVSAGRIYRQGTPTFVVPDLRATRNRAGVKPGTRTLQFSLERAVRVEASLFDVRGKLAAHLLSESRPAGAHRLGLPDHLTPGHYVLEFRAGDARQSIPVLLE